MLINRRDWGKHSGDREAEEENGSYDLITPCTFLSQNPPQFHVFHFTECSFCQVSKQYTLISLYGYHLCFDVSSSVIRIVKQNQLDRIINVYYSLFGWIIWRK